MAGEGKKGGGVGEEIEEEDGFFLRGGRKRERVFWKS